MPPDVISPGASLVIALETDDTGKDDGFLLQVSYIGENDDILQGKLRSWRMIELLWLILKHLSLNNHHSHQRFSDKQAKRGNINS